MLDRKEICSCRTFLDGKREFLYRYFLLENTKDIKVFEETITVPCYGIEVVREERVNGVIVDLDGDSLECMTTVKDKVVDVIEYLKEHEVSPVHLIDIVGDMADEWVSDFETTARSRINSAVLQ